MSPIILRTRILCTLSVLCCYMISLVLGASYNYGFDVNEALRAKRQSDETIIITKGMPPRQNGSLPVRIEVRDLEKDQDKWALYVLALDMMQYTSQSEITSWYSISSIHGVPFQPWCGVQPTSGNENSGYCQHETILFPPWHRAYLALYEQELCGRVQYIATLYPDSLRNKFEAAAADCRAPYFDWAAAPPSGESMLPDSIGGSSQVNVTGPAGTQLIANPLYTYEFKPLDPSIFYDVNPWASWNNTMRAPTSINPDAASNNSAINQNLVTHMAQNQQRLYNLFSNYGNYTIFSNEGWAADTSKYDSLESLHDNIHAMLGGQDGHMTIVPFSAFDPLFFLHHCMVDRILALWQVMYPRSWVIPVVARTNSYTTSVGQMLNSSSALTPFYASSNGTFWNSDMLRDPAKLGYTYPELEGISLSNMTSVSIGRPKVIAAITQLYGTYSVNRLVTGSQGPGNIHTRRLGGHFHHDPWRRSPIALPVSRIVSTLGQYREWIANIRVVKQGMQGPFSIGLAFSDGTSVGTMGVFASPTTLADMMQMAPGAQYIASTVPLTKSLVDKLSDGTISSLDPEDVGPYLKTNLKVCATKGDGTGVEPADVPGLSITIISAVVQATSNDESLPIWDDPDYTLGIM